SGNLIETLVPGRGWLRLVLDVRVAFAFHTLLLYGFFCKWFYAPLVLSFLHRHFLTMRIIVPGFLIGSARLDPPPGGPGLAPQQRSRQNRDEQYPHGSLLSRLHPWSLLCLRTSSSRFVRTICF